MTEQVPRPSYLRGLFGTAFLLSLVYLIMGLVVELLLRAFPVPLMDAISRAVDALPTNLLRRTGLLRPITALYLDDKLSKLSLRLIFAGTAVVFFYGVALITGGLMDVMRRLFKRPRRA